MDRLFRRMFYHARLHEYDLPEHRVGWKSRANQEARFQTLQGVTDLEGKRILDLGCGLGCLYGYLTSRGWRGDYTGFDILGAMVTEARLRFPGIRFENRDITSDPVLESWDVVLISGIFNHRVHDNLQQVREVLAAAWPLASEALAFNILRLETGWTDPEMFYAKDEELAVIAETLAPGKWRFVSGYLPEDITVYLYR
jgi:SAM-dependent methyltransferase